VGFLGIIFGGYFLTSSGGFIEKEKVTIKGNKITIRATIIRK
jgi:hypothetical protein